MKNSMLTIWCSQIPYTKGRIYIWYRGVKMATLTRRYMYLISLRRSHKVATYMATVI